MGQFRPFTCAGPSKAIQVSEFGLIIVTRKRVKQSLERLLTDPCPYCSGTGTVKQIGNFLYKIQTASIPVRVTDVQVNSKKEGTDDLIIQIGISTVYLAPDDKNPKSPAGPAAGRPNS